MTFETFLSFPVVKAGVIWLRTRRHCSSRITVSMFLIKFLSKFLVFSAGANISIANLIIAIFYNFYIQIYSGSCENSWWKCSSSFPNQSWKIHVGRKDMSLNLDHLEFICCSFLLCHTRKTCRALPQHLGQRSLHLLAALAKCYRRECWDLVLELLAFANTDVHKTAH